MATTVALPERALRTGVTSRRSSLKEFHCPLKIGIGSDAVLVTLACFELSINIALLSALLVPAWWKEGTGRSER